MTTPPNSNQPSVNPNGGNGPSKDSSSPSDDPNGSPTSSGDAPASPSSDEYEQPTTCCCPHRYVRGSCGTGNEPKNDWKLRRLVKSRKRKRRKKGKLPASKKARLE